MNGANINSRFPCRPLRLVHGRLQAADYYLEMGGRKRQFGAPPLHRRCPAEGAEGVGASGSFLVCSCRMEIGFSSPTMNHIEQAAKATMQLPISSACWKLPVSFTKKPGSEEHTSELQSP